MDGMGREKIPQISYRRAGDVSNFAIKMRKRRNLSPSTLYVTNLVYINYL
jgi:hypothetical protein